MEHPFYRPSRPRQSVALSSKTCLAINGFVARSSIALSASWINDYFKHNGCFMLVDEVLHGLRSLGLDVNLYCGNFVDMLRDDQPCLAVMDDGQLLYVLYSRPSEVFVLSHSGKGIQKISSDWLETNWRKTWIADANNPA